MKPIAPCKGCQERYVGCHGRCVRYQEFLVQNEEAKRKKKEQEPYTCYERNKISRINKLKRQHS